MALSPQTRVLLTLFAQLKPDGDEAGGKIARVNVDQEWASGTGVNQADGMFFDKRTLVASANEDIDMQTILDGNGNALGAAQVVAMMLEAPAANPGVIHMRDSATNPWTAFLASGAGSDGLLKLAPGATIALIAPQSAGYPVSGSDKVLNFLNTDGSNSNTYTITLITRSA